MVKKPYEQPRTVDATDWRILEVLQEDGRTSFTELGRRVGMSTPAVTERVRQLEAAGVIRGYRAELDLAKIGRPILAIVRMSVVGDVLAKVTDCVRKMPEVLECYFVTGEFDYQLKVAVHSRRELESFLMEKLTPVPGIARIATSIVLTEIKFTTSLSLTNDE